MVKHTQIICPLLPTNCLGVFDCFCVVGAERVKKWGKSHNFGFLKKVLIISTWGKLVIFGPKINFLELSFASTFFLLVAFS